MYCFLLDLYLRRKFLFSLRNLSNLCLNSAKISDLTISEGSAFQQSTTLCLKKTYELSLIRLFWKYCLVWESYAVQAFWTVKGLLISAREIGCSICLCHYPEVGTCYSYVRVSIHVSRAMMVRERQFWIACRLLVAGGSSRRRPDGEGPNYRLLAHAGHRPVLNTESAARGVRCLQTVWPSLRFNWFFLLFLWQP